MSQMSARDARAAAQSVIARAQAEPDFRSELMANPVSTLHAAGFSMEGAREFSQELRDDEVVGYRPSPKWCDFTCDVMTCWVTWCGKIFWTD